MMDCSNLARCYEVVTDFCLDSLDRLLRVPCDSPAERILEAVTDEDRAVCGKRRVTCASVLESGVCCREEDLESVLSGRVGEITPTGLEKIVRHVPVDVLDDSPGALITIALLFHDVEQVGNRYQGGQGLEGCSTYKADSGSPSVSSVCRTRPQRG